MQPPPRAAPSAASGPPPAASGGAPNLFRRTRPHKQTGSSTMMPGPAQPVAPMTDPFAFGRQGTSGVPAGSLPVPSGSSLPTMQVPSPAGFIQTAPVHSQPPHPQEGAQGPQPVLLASFSTNHNPGVASSLSSNIMSPTGAFCGPNSLPGLNAPGTEEGYFNTREHPSYITAGGPLQGPTASGSSAPDAVSHQPQSASRPVSSPWMPDDGSRPPSVQNYFQPTSDHSAQPLIMSPADSSAHVSVPAPSPQTPQLVSSPHSTQATPSPYPVSQKQVYLPQPGSRVQIGTSSVPNPAEHRGSDVSSGVVQPQNSQFQTYNYFSQNCTVPDQWLNQHPQEHFYHQMGGSASNNRPGSNSQQASPPGLSVPTSYASDPGTISVFFKEHDVENEETLTGEGNAVNGVPNEDTFGLSQVPMSNMLYSNPQVTVPQSLTGAESAQQGSLNTSGDHSAPSAELAAPYMNDSGFVSGTPKHEGHYDHVENLECVPNQEVLPSEPQKVPQSVGENLAPGQGSAAVQGSVHFEGGPNLETPDSGLCQVRPENGQLSYGSASHGTVSGVRRAQGVVGTFIQQEVPKPLEDSSAGYFEQIDTSPGGDGTQQHASTQSGHGQPPHIHTPSPPKPTGFFQASANSSFEPVRPHSVGVRPFGVDQARMVAEKSVEGPQRKGVPDASPGNLEQPPDNLENIFMTQHSAAGISERRPSSRAHGARLKCESPATTLWAQNELPVMSGNILLAPAAPAVLGPVKQPSAEVIQPPEDSPLDLQAPQRTNHPSQRPENTLENLENPPKLSEADPKNPQASLGYASLLVTSPVAESFQNQPVLIAPPATNCSVIPTNIPPPMAYHVISGDIPQNHGSDVGCLPLQKPSDLCANTVQAAPPKTSTHIDHFSAPVSSGSLGGRPAANQLPLNLAPERQIQKPENPLAASAAGHTNPPLSRSDSLGSTNHSAVPVNSHTPAAADNYKQSPNYKLLDFTMRHPLVHQNEPPGAGNVPSGASQPALPPALGPKPHVPVSNATGFYRQVTKDAQQQGGRGESDLQQQQPQSSAEPGPLPGAVAANSQQAALGSSHRPESLPNLQGEGTARPNQTTQVPPPGNQYPQQTPYPPQPGNTSRPQSALGGQPGYGGVPPVPGPMHGGYYGAPYPEYMDGRMPYPPYYPSSDPRAQQYYQDDPYRRYDPRYGQYEPSNSRYRHGERYQQQEQTERPSSRNSLYSELAPSRQGYPEDYQRANRSTYEGYYADYYKKQYGDWNWDYYNTQYRGYYEQPYWYGYDAEAYRNRSDMYSQPYPNRREGYDDRWRYDPRYDSSFDEDYRRQRDPYGDEFDRRSVHSEHSAHSAHSSRSRRSSFSSRSQQSQVYRSQQDLTSYKPPSQAPVDYSYGQYHNNADGSASYAGYQYPSEYPVEDQWSAVEQPPPRPATPEKFSVPHRCARFGPGGQMIQVLPNLPSAGQPALVEIHSLETELQDLEGQEELRSFPGPLLSKETHKVDVIKFAQNKSLECQRSDSLFDKDSSQLIWEFIVLLCRQNGTVVGTDIADLLLREHKSVWLPDKSPNEANLIDFTKEPLERAEDEPGSGPLSLLSDTFMTVSENAGKETERFRELLLFGRKKDALESAMKNGLWGHALLLASKMDNRTHARVMTRFANSLPINDPLQTVYQIMSGRMPAAATCCGDEKWGDWRPHLAMVLSNLTHAGDLDMRTITTMGDTLASKGLNDAAHFCYMMAQIGLGVYTKKSTKMVLIGSNHSLPFLKFASNEAIQRTEAYEYALSLGSQPCSLPNFQVYKFIYACRLAEAGLCVQAFHYCEVISKTVISMPSYYSPIFISQLVQLSDRLRCFDPQLKEKPDQELFVEPSWLLHLRHLHGQMKEGVFSYNTDRTTPQQYVCSTPSSEFDQSSPPEPVGMPVDSGTAMENPLMSSLLPSSGPPAPGVQLMPPAPPTILDEGMVSVPQVPPAIDSAQFSPAPVPLPPFPMPGYGPPYQMEPTYPGPPMSFPGPPMQPAPLPQEPQPSSQPSSPSRSTFAPEKDFYNHMASMVPGRRSRTTSQSSMHMGPGMRSRTTSESSNHSVGRERSSSAVKQPLPSPEPIPEQPARHEESKKSKKNSPKKGRAGTGGWLGWFYRKKNEAHLPDDKNKSIVWDEEKKRWVNRDEPEEENKPPPPPPTSFPKMAPQISSAGPGGPPSAAPPVNIFSRKAGTKNRYVDFLNQGGTSSKPGGSVPAPADLFAPLAPMPVPANLFVPGPVAEEQQPLEGSVPEVAETGEDHPNPNSESQMPKQTLYPPGQEGAPAIEGTQSGELSRSSSMSSLSREVSQHLNQVPNQLPAQSAPTPAGGVTFYNPSQFAQPRAPSGGSKQSRLGQRKYPTVK